MYELYREYSTWYWMKQRCNNSNHPNYEYYGGRGITVCKEWKIFKNFYLDMGRKPQGLTLDRIDNDGNYCKTNCKWATEEEQKANRRTHAEIDALRDPLATEFSRALYGYSEVCPNNNRVRPGKQIEIKPQYNKRKDLVLAMMFK